MKKQQIPLKNSLILLLTATIWGIAFVAQSEGGEAVGPLTFNATRNIIGSLVLIPVILLLNKINLNCRRHNLRYLPVSCFQLPTVWHPVHLRWKSRFSHCMLHYHRPDPWTFYEKEMQSFYLGCGCNGTDWSLSALHHRRLFHWKGRLSGPDLCFPVFPAHSGH